MTLSINTNENSINAQNNLYKTNNQLNKSLERLSSGSKLNRAADNAANLAISTQMLAVIAGLDQGTQNAQDGSNALNIVDSALQEIDDNLGRINELSLQAANDTNSAGARAAISAEITQRSAEIDRIANGTTFNGQNLLNGSAPSTYTIQTGAGNTSNDQINIAEGFGDSRWAALGLGAINVTTATAANMLASATNTARATIADRLANVGALTNRLASAVSNNQVSSENMAAANSRLRDTDIAAESANLTRNLILRQSNLSVLSQANSSPSAARKLLQG